VTVFLAGDISLVREVCGNRVEWDLSWGKKEEALLNALEIPCPMSKNINYMSDVGDGMGYDGRFAGIVLDLDVVAGAKIGNEKH
jgi:hypothetical protein